MQAPKPLLPQQSLVAADIMVVLTILTVLAVMAGALWLLGVGRRR